MKGQAATRYEQREPPCIWVLAGVLSYRLCDRSYECEGCELFHALSGGVHTGRSVDASRSRPGLYSEGPGTRADPVSWTEEQVTSYLDHVLGDCRLYLDRHYRPPHFWLLDEGEGKVRVGLAAHVRRILNPIEQIVVPCVGLHFDRDQPCGWITRHGMAISLSMPISGRVCSVNEASLDRGEACPDHGEPWLFRIEASEALSDVEDLVRGEHMLLWYIDSIGTLKRYVREALASPPVEKVGRLMADGGEPESCLADVLGRARFERLLDELIRR